MIGKHLEMLKHRFNVGLRSSIIMILLMLASTALFADVNVLIIGSTKDSTDHYSISGTSQTFSPTQIRSELQSILDGAGLGTANVTLEDRYNYISGDYSYNLISWFHFPWPADNEVTNRWPNLRGELGTEWDYVILIGDPYTIEYMPGLYTHGVARVAKEVAKGSAETILLMPWPAAGSASTVSHYKNVVYRTGRSGGFKVVPAALAWEASGSPTGGTHPGPDGAYIAAASIFSRIWGQSAANSSYTYNDTLAETVHSAVAANVGAQQYTGKFNFQSPYRMFDRQDRYVSPRSAKGGSSTEADLVGRSVEAVRRAGVNNGGGWAYTIGRDSGSPSARKDYRNRGPGPAFGYYYQVEPGNADEPVGNIVGYDIRLAARMIGESDDYRLAPRRILLGELLQFDPGMQIEYGGHIYGPQATAMTTYMYTLVSGRCPVDPEPTTITGQWYAQKVGYEMAWRVATCQSRAPGFKVMPSARLKVAVACGTTETMTVQFILPPETNVTVDVSISGSSVVSVSPSTLTFTPANYATPQEVTVTAAGGQAVESDFNVVYSTTSNDEVYNDLDDSWAYTYIPNIIPVANAQSVWGVKDQAEFITLTGSDGDGHALTYAVVDQPTNGTLDTTTGANLTYTPNAGYTGNDSFTFKVNDGFDDSAVLTLSIVVVESNNVPTANAGPDQTVALGSGDYPWTPTDVGFDTFAWYDASDASTITSINSEGTNYVSQLADKSGNGKHLSGAGRSSQTDKKSTTSTRTQNGLNVLDFDGNDFMSNSSFFTPDSGNISVFIVAGMDIINRSDDCIFSFDINDAGDRVNFLANHNTQFNGGISAARQGSHDFSGGPYSGPSIYGMSIEQSATDITMSGYVDGATKINYNDYIQTRLHSMRQFKLMARSGNPICPDGFVGEVIVCESVTTEERQKIEGYLAWKWETAGNLPVDHPYKNAAPMTSAAVATLDGSTTDGGDGSTLTTNWEIISGPAGALSTIADATAQDSTVLFRKEGTYVLRLTADDVIDQTTDTVTITVNDRSAVATSHRVLTRVQPRR